jgi:hypothetical protein
MSIIGILNQIKNGEVVLPAIQRDFVWSDSQITNLLDSILRGYPVGIALMWETYEPLQYREFVTNHRGGLRALFKETKKGERRRVVLDGQQRLQSLYVAVYGTKDGKHLCFDVLSGHDSDDSSEPKFGFDFAQSDELAGWNAQASEEMQKQEDQREEGYVPYYGVLVSELFAMGAKSRESFVTNLSSDLSLSVDEVARMRVNLSTFDQMLNKDSNALKLSIIDENLPHDSEDRKSTMDVLEIFVRVNTGGTRLNRSDLIFSMLKLNWKESAEELPEFVDRINEGNSFGITIDFVIRCLFTVSDLGAKFDLELLRKRPNVEKLRGNFGKCCRAIEATVDFVAKDCWIQTSRLVGGLQTLVPFVYYIFRLEKHRIPDRELEKVRMAFFLLAFSGVLSRYGESRIGALVRRELKPQADQGDDTFPVEKIADWIHAWNAPNYVSEELLRSNTQLTLHLVQGLSGGHPKYEDNLPEVDHIFPRATLREQKYDESLINHFANFWILARGKNRNKSDKHPKKYFEDVSDGEMKRALIQRDLLDFRSYKRFLEERQTAIIGSVAKKLGASPASGTAGDDGASPPATVC